MKILFLDAYFYPESTPFSYIEKNIIEALVNNGNEISVICPIPTRGIDSDTRKKYKHIKEEELFNQHVHIERFWAPYERRSPISRFFRYILCNVFTYFKARKLKNISVIFAGSTPPTQGILAWLVKKKLNVPLIYDLQDIFPDSLVNSGLSSKNSCLWKIGRLIENKTYAAADRIVVISNDFKANLLNKGVPEQKITVIPNWADQDNVFLVKREENKLFDRFGLDRSRFYICYSGNLGHSQNLELIIEVAESIQDTMPDVLFVFIGEGAAKEDFEKTIEEKQLRNVKVFPFQPYEDIASVFSLGDVGLIISKPGIGRSSVPSKTWSIMAAERPILTSFDMDSELVSLIDTIGCGVTAEAGNKEKLIEAIRSLIADHELTDKGRLGREYLSIELDKDKCVGKYIEAIESAKQGEIYE